MVALKELLDSVECVGLDILGDLCTPTLYQLVRDIVHVHVVQGLLLNEFHALVLEVLLPNLLELLPDFALQCVLEI